MFRTEVVLEMPLTDFVLFCFVLRLVLGGRREESEKAMEEKEEGTARERKKKEMKKNSTHGIPLSEKGDALPGFLRGPPDAGSRP